MGASNGDKPRCTPDNIADAVVHDSFEESPELLGYAKEIGWSTVTGAVDTDIILRCRIDKLMGDSGEADVEERRSCSVGIALAGIGEKTSQNPSTLRIDGAGVSLTTCRARSDSTSRRRI